ncbi:MAG: hypothetical protein IJT79_08305 [Ruminococcus sp.]|nr:hypothetical protein [Ruminococcus sp.]
MELQFIFIILFIVSVLTSLTVQGIKSLFKKNNANYSANILAAVVAAVISFGTMVLYCIYFEKPPDNQIVVETVLLIFFSFLTATNGYDKVVQTIKQIKSKIGDENNGS